MRKKLSVSFICIFLVVVIINSVHHESYASTTKQEAINYIKNLRNPFFQKTICLITY